MGSNTATFEIGGKPFGSASLSATGSPLLVFGIFTVVIAGVVVVTGIVAYTISKKKK